MRASAIIRGPTLAGRWSIWYATLMTGRASRQIASVTGFDRGAVDGDPILAVFWAKRRCNGAFPCCCGRTFVGWETRRAHAGERTPDSRGVAPETAGCERSVRLEPGGRQQEQLRMRMAAPGTRRP